MKALALVALALIASVSAEAKQARILGETVLNRVTEGDAIPVLGRCPSPANSPVSAVSVQVLRNNAEINYLAVRYGNGMVDRLEVRQFFREGTHSRWIDLNLGRRCVEEILVIGETKGIGPKALVRVFGAK